jgi:hypothetical protein
MGLDVHDMEGLGEYYVGYNDKVKRSDQFGLAYLRFAKKLEPGDAVLIKGSRAAKIEGIIEVLSEAMQQVVHYIPKLLVATVVVVIGLLAASLLRGIVATSADRVGLSYAEYLANGCYYILALITFLAAAGQLGLQLELLEKLILIAFGAVAAGCGLALGLGGRDRHARIDVGKLGAVLQGVHHVVDLFDGDGFKEVAAIKHHVLGILVVDTHLCIGVPEEGTASGVDRALAERIVGEVVGRADGFQESFAHVGGQLGSLAKGHGVSPVFVDDLLATKRRRC